MEKYYTPSLPPEKAEEIHSVLEQVLGSHLFRGSRPYQRLLRHVTEQTLAGEFTKTRILATHVW
jgi:hypothetical protein